MKRNIFWAIFGCAMLISFTSWSQVSINSTGASPDASSILDVSSTDKGLLIPRMTATERDNIATPATGLLVYVTNDDHYYYYNGTGWIDLVLASDNDWTLSGNDMYSSVTGNVGIGTMSPTGKLHVESGIDNAGYFTTNSSSPNTSVLYSEYTGTTGVDAYAVYGASIPTDYFGYGGYFEGGYIGVYGEVSPTGANEYYGFWGACYGANGTNYGSYFESTGTGTNYAVYGQGYFTGSSYAGYFSGDVTVTGTLSSPIDNILKANIQPYEGAIEKIKGLEVQAFEYTNQRSSSSLVLPQGTRIGFAPESVQAQFPGMMRTIHQPVKKEDKSSRGESPVELDGMNQLEMIPVLTKAIQEQQDLIEKLEKRIAELENKTGAASPE